MLTNFQITSLDFRTTYKLKENDAMLIMKENNAYFCMYEFLTPLRYFFFNQVG